MAKKTKRKATTASKRKVAAKSVVKKPKKASIEFPQFSKFPQLIMGITVLALVIRLMNVAGLTLWVDEYVHVLGVKDFVAGKGPLMPYDGNGFLFNVTILPLFALFGDSPLMARIPSALAGGFAVYFVYLLIKEVFNREIAIYAATLATFSVFLVFWSRVARNYSLFLLTYTFLLWAFYKAVNPKEENLTEGSIWQRWQIDPKYAGLTLLGLILAFFSHKLVLFFFFSVVFYVIIMAIDTTVVNRKFTLQNKYTALAIPAGLFLILFFIPSLTAIFRPIIASATSEGMANWVLPDWTEIGRLWEEEKYEVYTIYKNVLLVDQPILYILGLIGLVAAFVIDRKSGYFLLCFFLVPLLLMCFVLRGVYNARYLVFLYPLFLTGIGTTAYFIFHWLPKKINADFYQKKLYNFSLFLPLLLLIGCGRIGKLKDLVTVKYRNGYVIEKDLSVWSFTNWKDATDYLKANMQNGDVVMSTLTNGVNYYMGWGDTGAIQFRQTYLDINTGEYVNYTDPPSNLNARTIDNLRKTIEENPRGWLLADYYFENIYTAPEARDLVMRYMDLHFDATPAGDVKVYSWDNTKDAKIPKQDVMIMVGRSRSDVASEELDFNLEAQYLEKEKLSLRLGIQAVNDPEEGFLILNREYKYFIPKNTTQGIDFVTIPLQKSTLRAGNNTIQFGYEKGAELNDPRRGFSVHVVELE
ncbi:MAG: glycosyltransferase family 39 protein [Bacteroidota bacterium]